LRFARPPVLGQEHLQLAEVKNGTTKEEKKAL
jgi:hypothetical protein